MRATDSMPTIGRMVSAVGLMIVAWFASEQTRTLMPPHTDFGYFNTVNVALGCVCGWVVTGKRLGRGFSQGISAGWTGLAALVFWAIFLQAANEMLDLSLHRRFDGPLEAIVGMFNLSLDYVKLLLDAKLAGILVGGAAIIGLISELVARRWS